MKNGGLNTKEDWRFTVKQISKNINENIEDVNKQLDYLFYKKLIYCEKNESEITNPYCWVRDKGIENYTSFTFINDGKLLQSTLFNNISTGFFQIIVGIIAVLTIIFSYMDSKRYREEVLELERKIENTRMHLSNLKADLRIVREINDSLSNNKKLKKVN